MEGDPLSPDGYWQTFHTHEAANGKWASQILNGTSA